MTEIYIQIIEREQKHYNEGYHAFFACKYSPGHLTLKFVCYDLNRIVVYVEPYSLILLKQGSNLSFTRCIECL